MNDNLFRLTTLSFLASFIVMSIQYEAYPTFSYQALTIISTFTLPAPPGEVNHHLVTRELLTLIGVSSADMGAA